MYLIQLYLPLADNEGKQFPEAHFAIVKKTLTEQFGGITTFTRAPADGVWKSDAIEEQHDQIVVFEVVTKAVDQGWWRNYRTHLESVFAQESLQIISQRVELL